MINISKNQYMRKQLIVETIRDWIIRGEYKPGQQLQTRAEIEKIFSTTPNTVQKACKQLVDDGYLTVRPKKGTYVAEAPPHQYDNAILIRSPQNTPGWSQYWTTMRQVAEEISSTTPYNISIRTCIDVEFDTAEYHSLLDDISQHRLGGLIFAFDPELAIGTPLVEASGLARVSLMSSSLSNIPAIQQNTYAFLDRSLEALKRKNRRRIATIVMGGMKDGELLQKFEERVIANGMVYDECWVQGVGIENKEWAENIVRLLLKGDAANRPDGLVVFDDNFVNPVCSGIINSGLQVGKNLDVVAHANFPLMDKDILPITRLGYDIRKMFRALLDLMRQQRQGNVCSESIVIQPVFADEIKEKNITEYF